MYEKEVDFIRAYLAQELQCNYPIIFAIDVALQSKLTTEVCRNCAPFPLPTLAICSRARRLYFKYKENLLSRFKHFGWTVIQEDYPVLATSDLTIMEKSLQRVYFGVEPRQLFCVATPDIRFDWKVGIPHPFCMYTFDGESCVFETFSSWETAVLEHFQIN